MPSYHFITQYTEPLSGERLRSEHSPGIQFAKADFYDASSEAIMLLKDCLGSLIFVDRVQKGLGKLHIGNLLIKHPHVEEYREAGIGKEMPRIDLHQIDLEFAIKRLDELKKLRDPAEVNRLKERYAQKPISGWYSTPHRLRQLEISPKGLEGKIEEIAELIEMLRTDPRNNLVSTNAEALETMSERLVKEICELARKYDEENETIKAKQKIIVSPEIISSSADIYSILKETLDFVNNHPRLDLERASRYWQEVDDWGNL